MIIGNERGKDMADENVKNSEQTTIACSLDTANNTEHADKAEGNATSSQANSQSLSENDKETDANTTSADGTVSESKQTAKSEPTCKVYVSDESSSPQESKHSSHFGARLLFILASIIALPFCLLFFAVGIGFTLATLGVLFSCFVITAMIFFPDLWASRLAYKPIIDIEAIPYFSPYIEAMSTEYRSIVSVILLFLIALIILAIAFLVLKVAKTIWHGLGRWRNKLSR